MQAVSEGPIVPGLGLGAGEGTTFILKAENISLSTFVNTYTYIQNRFQVVFTEHLRCA